MAPRKPRQIGTAAETAVVKYLRANGWPSAERRSLRGQLDAGDITGTPGVCWEIKGGTAAKAPSDGQVTLWLSETETERVNAGADIGILVLQRPRVGPANAGRWWAILRIHTLTDHLPDITGYWSWMPVRLHLADAVAVLRAKGYGQPLDEDAA